MSKRVSARSNISERELSISGSKHDLIRLVVSSVVNYSRGSRGFRRPCRNMENLYNVFVDSEESAIDVRFPSVKKLPDLKGKACMGRADTVQGTRPARRRHH
jgi:hypothetical protein